MGSYVPAKPTRKRSVADTLAEAERDHFLDCPNADFWIRAAACLLDTILIFILFSALDRLFVLLLSAPFMPPADKLGNEWKMVFSLSKLIFQSLVVFMSNLWAVSMYGGSPGKLLLGLKIINTYNGEHLTFPQTFFRELLGKGILDVLSLGLGLAIPLFRKDQKALHDLVCATVVKKVR